MEPIARSIKVGDLFGGGRNVGVIVLRIVREKLSKESTMWFPARLLRGAPHKG